MCFGGILSLIPPLLFSCYMLHVCVRTSFSVAFLLPCCYSLLCSVDFLYPLLHLIVCITDLIRMHFSIRALTTCLVSAACWCVVVLLELVSLSWWFVKSRL